MTDERKLTGGMAGKPDLMARLVAANGDSALMIVLCGDLGGIVLVRYARAGPRSPTCNGPSIHSSAQRTRRNMKR